MYIIKIYGEKEGYLRKNKGQPVIVHSLSHATKWEKKADARKVGRSFSNSHAQSSFIVTDFASEQNLVQSLDLLSDSKQTIPEPVQKMQQKVIAFENSKPNTEEPVDDLLNGMITNVTQLFSTLEKLPNLQKQISYEQKKLDGMVLDIQHYLEFYDVSDDELLNLSKQLVNVLRKRRQVQEQSYLLSCVSKKTDVQSFSELSNIFNNQHNLTYTPRVLKELFEERA